MKATLDINVFLDVFQKGEPHHAASARVVGLVTAGTLAGVCPAHGLTTLYYLVRKHASKPEADAAMDQVLRHFQIGNLEAAGWQDARRLPLADFEDEVLATVAKATESVFIVTRNGDDFAGSPVPAITPADFLSNWQRRFEDHPGTIRCCYSSGGRTGNRRADSTRVAAAPFGRSGLGRWWWRKRSGRCGGWQPTLT